MAQCILFFYIHFWIVVLSFRVLLNLGTSKTSWTFRINCKVYIFNSISYKGHVELLPSRSIQESSLHFSRNKLIANIEHLQISGLWSLGPSRKID